MSREDAVVQSPCLKLNHIPCLRLGNNLIADAMNPWGLTRKEWNNVASEVGASFINVDFVCSNEEEHRARRMFQYSHKAVALPQI